MTTITDTEVRVRGMEALIAALGEVHAEKFITLIMREPFDYTEWQRTLWNNKTVEEISKMAMERRGKTNG
uniref:Uncharacterized protein n=1 Tax=Candidatus Kentrum sp. UNK TaxID=2126344 RepID=A0A451AKD2_9GAMM|nr:MAG: hypothetical protein BECKUNK1418G_GA0071005_10965 [Candidatus Kentron sp. UNK]VFK71862.1 MAG: hypothetical protein BECKUNK1418H_GA0071006_10855 [Candidatus Kentron sp. UNK]